ncbi:MAG: DUF1848 family protein [Burkholderiales bacterium]|nr:DUF1848 family protein [Burkholderiales bacterium]
MDPRAHVPEDSIHSRTSMIVSASVNADIPAYHGAWFTRRLDEGYCRVARIDGLGALRVPLTPETVQGFVFWTRNVDPFLPVLDRMHREGFAFTIQFAITGYSHELDPAPVSVESVVAQIARLSDEFGSRSVVWRYDPLLVTSLTPLEWHLGNFERIACLLAGATDEIVLAFARVGRKTQRTRSAATASEGPQPGQMRDLVKRLARIASGCRMRFALCAQPDWLAPGAVPARCIDAQRLGDVARRPITAATAGFLPGCLCAQAIDIGDCGVGGMARFCGALPRIDRRTHDPEAEFLFPTARRFLQIQGTDLPF